MTLYARKVRMTFRSLRKPSPGRMATPREAAKFLIPLLSTEVSEVFGILLLNNHNDLIGWHVVSRGSSNVTVVTPADVFLPAILARAAGIVLTHNHPSGSPTPSPEDIQITKRLKDAGALLGIPVLDHMIIADTQYLSLYESGYLS